MKKTSIFFLMLAFVLGAVCYVSTTNMLYALIIITVFILDYFVLLRRRFKHYFDIIERIHNSYHFINAFIITLSVKDSLEDAYQNGIRINNKRLNLETEQLGEMTVIERVKYLKGYFKLSIYSMFLNVLALYQDQGGNILPMSDNLMRECTRAEKTLSDTVAIGNKHLREFVVLWILSFGILLFMRFSLKEFYLSMFKNQLIGLLILVFFFICIISINLFVNGFTNMCVKEAKND